MKPFRVERDAYRPCLIVAHEDAVYSAQASRAFRRLGWDVYLASSGPEARRLSRMLFAEIVVLGADLPEESGWLTCDKLMRDLPDLRVILVESQATYESEEFAAFVGAAGLIHKADGIQALVDEAIGSEVPVNS